MDWRKQALLIMTLGSVAYFIVSIVIWGKVVGLINSFPAIILVLIAGFSYLQYENNKGEEQNG